MRNIRTLAQLFFAIFVRPVFPLLQWLGRVSGLAKEAKTVEGPHRRQPYFVGHLQPGISFRELSERLAKEGYFPEPMAYPDPGQLLSLRRLSDEHNDQQYHLRIFNDREVRGHLEYTPEDRPFSHMDETLFEPRTEEFVRALGPFLDSKN